MRLLGTHSIQVVVNAWDERLVVLKHCLLPNSTAPLAVVNLSRKPAYSHCSQ